MKNKMFLGCFILLAVTMLTTVAYSEGKEMKSWGIPFQQIWHAITDLQEQIDNIQLIPGPQGEQGPPGEQGPKGEGGGLFSMHTVVENGDVECTTENLGGRCPEIPGMPIPRDGKLVSLAVNIYENTLNNTAKITVLVNDTSTALQLQVPAGPTSIETIVTDVGVKAGDLIKLEVDATAAGAGVIRITATTEYQAD